MTDFSELTTTRVGGPATHLVEAATADELADAALEAWGSGEPWLILGGGSNLLVGDEGFDGTTIRVVSRGIESLDSSEEQVTLRVQAGEVWDDLVAHAVEHGLAGIEALSGIPGSVGAAPIQNIGAYGQELSGTLVAIDFLDFVTEERVRLSAAELDFGYRQSAIKKGRHGVVLAVELRLRRGGLSEPLRYAQLAEALHAEIGDARPLAEVRAEVLRLRASKGMLLSDADPDSVSTGSFFTNPIVSARFAAALPSDAPRWPQTPERPARVVPLDEASFGGAELLAAPAAPVASEPMVKLSAAWLIERAGIRRGFALPGSHAAISSKHTLAIVNTGEATAAQVGELARYVQGRVLGDFGVLLQPEPVLVGVEL